MTSDRFAELCEKYSVHPAVALENVQIQQALANRDDAEVERILREEF